MTANFARSVDVGHGSHGSLSELSERGWREEEQSRNRARSMQSLGAPLIQAVNTLARSPLFSGLSDEDIARLNARCLWRRVRAGAFLLDEPADGYALSVVTNGRVRAVRMINGREIILRDIDEGEYFGGAHGNRRQTGTSANRRDHRRDRGANAIECIPRGDLSIRKRLRSRFGGPRRAAPSSQRPPK
jgi:hypothetical protein